MNSRFTSGQCVHADSRKQEIQECAHFIPFSRQASATQLRAAPTKTGYRRTKMRAAFSSTRARRRWPRGRRPGASHPVAGDGGSAGKGGLHTIATVAYHSKHILRTPTCHTAFYVNLHSFLLMQMTCTCTCIKILPFAAHLRSRQDLVPVLPPDWCLRLQDALQLHGNVIRVAWGTNAAEMIGQTICYARQMYK